MKVSIMCSAFLMFMLFSTHGKGQAGFEWPMAGHCIASLDEGKVELQLTEWPDSDYDILAIGGMVGDSVVSSCDHYDAESDLWNPIASLPNPRIEFTAHTFAGKVYVIGGWDGDSTVYTDVLEFDPSVGEWGVVTSLLGPRKGHASVHEGPTESGSILVCGGNNGTAGLATCELVNLLNYEVLPADTMVEPRERFQLFRMEKYSSEQFTMNIGETWKEGHELLFPQPYNYSVFEFPHPDIYQGILAVGGFNHELNNPTSSCELLVDSMWEPVQDLPMPLTEYSYGMGVNPYVFEAGTNNEASFSYAVPQAWSTVYIFGGETVNLETGEEASSNELLTFQVDSLAWQSYWVSVEINQGWKNQVLLHSPRIRQYPFTDGELSVLAYLIGGEMVYENSSVPNPGYFVGFGSSVQGSQIPSTEIFLEPEICNPNLQMLKPAFVQQGERGYIIGGNGTSIWIDLSPVFYYPYSITELTANKLIVFPNPSSDQMTLRGESHSLKWKLFDSWGRIILFGQGQEIKVNNLSPGPYHLHTEDGRKAIVLVEK
jgi:hypothetical protein